MEPDERGDGCDVPWYETAFEAPYLELYRHRTDEAANEEVAWAAAHIGQRLEERGLGRRLLELACGNGRHARALARSGFEVTGLDYSEDLLVAAEALEKARVAGDEADDAGTSAKNAPPPRARVAGDRGAETRNPARPIRYVRGDMRALPLDGPFDVVTSFFTSFGYFADEADDRKVLAEVARVLVPGGVYLLDFLQATQVRASLVPESVEEREGWRLVQRRRISPDGRRVEKSVDMTDPQGRRTKYIESVRLYELCDFEAMVPPAGLQISEVFGSLAGDPLREDSPRLVVLARR